MNLLNELKKKIKTRLGIPCYKPEPTKWATSLVNPLGTVLYSYLDYPLGWSNEDVRLDGHSNLWESREVAKIFQELGFNVEAVAWTDQFFYPKKQYEVVFDIHTNLQRWAPFMQKEAKKLLHLTGSYFNFQRDAELARVADFEARTSCLYSPKRIPQELDLAERSHKLAQACSLIGNSQTRSTYPLAYQEKISMIPVSGSKLMFFKTTADEYVPAVREFLWFYGGGAVHKGLDLVLEVFKRNPTLKLHVVAKLESERDFFLAYGNELLRSPNVTYHGYLHPSSKKFQDIANRVVANLGPSCSEGISPAIVTCLQYGFYPIISVYNGVTLPSGAGIYLSSCSIDEIEEKLLLATLMPRDSLIGQIKACQEFALAEFSRENFSTKMRAFLVRALGIS
jgi:hypothetical protein